MTPTVEAALDARLHPFSDGIRVELDAHSEHLREHRSDFEGYRNAVDSRLDSLATDIAVLTRYLPKIMNTVASQNAVHRDQQRKIHSLQSVVDGLPGRIEFIRKEILLEQRYQADAPVTLPAPEPKIINEEKLHGMGDNLRINLGAGHVPLADYLNVGEADDLYLCVTCEVEGCGGCIGRCQDRCGSLVCCECFVPDDEFDPWCPSCASAARREVSASPEIFCEFRNPLGPQILC